jgi:hypothetical protein
MQTVTFCYMLIFLYFFFCSWPKLQYSYIDKLLRFRHSYVDTLEFVYIDSFIKSIVVRSLEFSIDLILPAALRFWSSLQQKRASEIFMGAKG